ncbi:hypothetical protein CC85DRAFT_298848, partial [Cutaneotrichosporon oleaginosum]
ILDDIHDSILDGFYVSLDEVYEDISLDPLANISLDPVSEDISLDPALDFSCLMVDEVMSPATHQPSSPESKMECDPPVSAFDAHLSLSPSNPPTPYSLPSTPFTLPSTPFPLPSSPFPPPSTPFPPLSTPFPPSSTPCSLPSTPLTLPNAHEISSAYDPALTPQSPGYAAPLAQNYFWASPSLSSLTSTSASSSAPSSPVPNHSPSANGLFVSPMYGASATYTPPQRQISTDYPSPWPPCHGTGHGLNRDRPCVATYHGRLGIVCCYCFRHL